MIQLLLSGQYTLFFVILLALVMSLSVHEWGHAFAAKRFGDDTAERMGRLTLNPMAHIDPVGLLMVIMVGFGYAKPVPTDPSRFNSRYATLWVAAAGPAMNLLLAFLAVNLYALAMRLELSFLQTQATALFIAYLSVINLVLMLFNLIPLGALDGHYILPYLLDRQSAVRYIEFNERYGNMVLMGLVLLSVAGLPIFSFVFRVGRAMLPWLSIL